ncbi:MAG: rod shape-determining protein RodA, partial [Acidobacteria bacterium]|nr:rod shape-determining protein RodA [Acidobacteriota bacterium]
MLERRLYYHIDWALIAAVGAMCAIGLAMIFSTTGGPTRQYWTQIYAVALGMGVMFAAMTVDYRSLADKSHLFFIGLILALVAVMFVGSRQMGAQRWLDLGVFNLQPSEFAKAIIALVLAKLLGESRRPVLSNNELFMAIVLTAIPLLLIAQQPDLGTAVTLLPILLVVTFAAGLPVKYLGVMAVLAVLTAPVAWSFALKDYQKERIETFLDPEQDARGAGYQQLQARITVGSGGLWGKGFRQGTQGQLRFLPVAHNDFIFSVLAEEQGFAGVLVVLGLYLFVIM